MKLHMKLLGLVALPLAILWIGLLIPLKVHAAGSCCIDWEGACTDVYTEEPCPEGNPNKKIVQSVDASLILRCKSDEPSGYVGCFPFLTYCSYWEVTFDCDGSSSDRFVVNQAIGKSAGVIRCPQPPPPPT